MFAPFLKGTGSAEVKLWVDTPWAAFLCRKDDNRCLGVCARGWNMKATLLKQILQADREPIAALSHLLRGLRVFTWMSVNTGNLQRKRT